jgi:hypothetical protein
MTADVPSSCQCRLGPLRLSPWPARAGWGRLGWAMRPAGAAPGGSDSWLASAASAASTAAVQWAPGDRRRADNGTRAA